MYALPYTHTYILPGSAMCVMGLLLSPVIKNFYQFIVFSSLLSLSILYMSLSLFVYDLMSIIL